MAEHVYRKCTQKKCDICNGMGEVSQGDGSKECDFCRGTGRTRCSGCRYEGMDCWYESLAFCGVCGGLEGALLPYCPGVMLSPEEHDRNYAHYCAKTGPFARLTLDGVTDARLYAERYVLEDDGPGARRFYDAVQDLWEFTRTTVCAICDGTRSSEGGVVEPANVFVCNRCLLDRVCP